MKCDYCDRDIPKEEPIYSWRGLSLVYCSSSCAGWGCPNAILQKKKQTEVSK